MPIAVPHFDGQPVARPMADVVMPSGYEPVIRMATVADVHGMSALINKYAGVNVMLARGPQYLYQHIQDYMVITAPAKERNGNVVAACGALHVLWEDLAEIRSIAVHPDCQGLGFGRMLVDALLDRCRRLGIFRAFAFTLVPGFFEKCGFSEFNRDNLPPVVWVECSKCPKFYRCDEIGMMRKLEGNGAER